jgi:hypothetical protein
MSEKKELYLLKLLHIIKNNLTIESLVDLGLDYSQIASLLSDAITDGYIIDHDKEGLVLTKTGMDTIEMLNIKINPLTSKDFLLPLDNYRIDKIDKYAVYLPKNKRLIL